MNHKGELVKANGAECQPAVNLSEAHFTLHAIKSFPK